MKIEIYKADAITDDDFIKDVRIDINQKLISFDNVDDKVLNQFYWNEAALIANALFNSLPQATFDRLIIELMSKKLSVYRGRQKKENNNNEKRIEIDGQIYRVLTRGYGI